MIHTAEYYIKGYDEWVTNGVPFTISTMDAIKAINEARIEAIKECAETMYDYYDPMYGFDKDKFLKETIEKIK